MNLDSNWWRLEWNNGKKLLLKKGVSLAFYLFFLNFFSKYNAIRSKGGPYSWGAGATVYFVVLVLFGNCEWNSLIKYKKIKF